MTFKLGTKSLRNLEGPPSVHPRMITLAHEAIAISTVDFGFPNKQVRTAAEQNALFKKGVTKKDGYKSISNHQAKADGFGHAIDAVPWINGKWEFNDWEPYYAVASAFAKAAHKLKMTIVWGGNWYDTSLEYGDEISDMKEAVERYKREHPGPDFIDGPHFELRL